MLTFLCVLREREKNHAPVIEDQSFTVAENVPPGTVVGQAAALDELNQGLIDTITFKA